MTANIAPFARTISVPAKNDVLRAIEQRADDRNLPLGQAVISLVEDGLIAAALAPAEASMLERPMVADELANVPIDCLLGEIGRRLEGSVTQQALQLAIARAEEAERKLATIGATLAEGVN